MTCHSEAEINTIKNASVRNERKKEIARAYVSQSSQESEGSLLNLQTKSHAIKERKLVRK